MQVKDSVKDSSKNREYLYRTNTYTYRTNSMWDFPAFYITSMPTMKDRATLISYA